MKEVRDLREIIKNCDDEDFLVLLLDKPNGYEILDINNVSVRKTGNVQELTIILKSRKN